MIENQASLIQDKKKQNFVNAQSEEILAVEVQNTNLIITHQNVDEVKISFYRVDLEVLFSRNPFIVKQKDEFSFIVTTHIEKLEKLVYKVPEKMNIYNLYVEVRTENKAESVTYFSTSFKVQVIENYGQIKVCDNNLKPLPKVYVKCFAKEKNSQVSFYKDGYTDLRGIFDYATLNSKDICTIEKFAIFIMSDELGSLIKEARAPNSLGKIDQKLLSRLKKN